MNETVRKTDDVLAKIFKIIGQVLKYSFYACRVAFFDNRFYHGMYMVTVTADMQPFYFA